MSNQYHECIIPAMDILIGDPDILDPDKSAKKRADHFYIPLQYVDRIDDFYHEQTTRGDSARQLTVTLGHMLEHVHQSGNNFLVLKNGMTVHFENIGIESDSSKTQAIQLAKKLQGEKRRVAIMTGSPRMVMKAAAAKVDIAHASPEIYSGRRAVKADADVFGIWVNRHKITAAEWHDLYPKEDPLNPNEFVELNFTGDFGRVCGPYEHIGRFDYYQDALVPLRYPCFPGNTYRRITPATAIQAMYFEALMAPVEEIPVVVFSGVYGVGKTFLPVAVGLYSCGYRTNSVPPNQFDRIFIVPRDGALGRDIGFLPGSLTDKTLPKAKPVLDNLKEVLKLLEPDKPAKFTEEEETGKKRAKKRKEKQPALSKNDVLSGIMNTYFEFGPLINMGGRSISDSLIIYDEFQDMERFQARELVSRSGDNSKMVIMGDSSQTSNIHLSKTSNGLNYIAGKLAAEPFAAVISTFDEDDIVRSWGAKQVAKALKN